jgi:ABC-2 type transport system permease protein
VTTFSGVVRFTAALVVQNLRSSLALRGAFWLQAAFMLLNNLAFFSTWWILFHRFENVGGWNLRDVTALFGMVASGYGLSVVFLGGTRDLARAIDAGELDTLLVQPKPTLWHALASRSNASGWGDLTTGVGMLYVAGALAPAQLPWTFAAIVASGSVFTSAGVIAQSLAFWMRGMETLARQIWEFTLTFSLYPRALFGGGMSILLYTLIPAGFVSFLPVELVRAPSAGVAVAALGAAAFWIALARFVFQLGLRRYESGNQIGARL